ncbi:hypothetical protein ACP8GD_22755, partial [Klebsiella pneumoniae]
KNSLNRLIRCVCGKKIGPDPRNFNQRVSLGRNDLLIRTFLNYISPEAEFTPPVIYSTKRREKLIFMAEAIPALQQAGRMKIGQPFDVEIIGDE